jgi:hypothetical protein
MHSRFAFSLAGGILAVLISLAANAVMVKIEQDRITGRVFDSSTNRGIAGLSVRLLAPRAAKLPVRVTITDANGEFAFKGVTTGKYLLEINRGTTLLYRKEIDNSIATSFTVPLEPVAK